MGERR